jgi:AcrR family transcriptional regulator
VTDRRGDPGQRGTSVEEATRARIRDSAIERIARSGVGVGLRAIAADAGVSAPLVVHYFGSKEGLLDACDESALSLLRENRYQTVTAEGARPGVLQRMSETPDLAPAALYVMRRIQAGGQRAGLFLDQVVQNAHDVVEAGVAAGTFKPSVDPWGRARYLALTSVGAMMVDLTLVGEVPDDVDLTRATQSVTLTTSLASLELYTNGLLASDQRFRDYLAAQGFSPPPSQTSAED